MLGSGNSTSNPGTFPSISRMLRRVADEESRRFGGRKREKREEGLAVEARVCK